jgi:hypothetical protein
VFVLFVVFFFFVNLGLPPPPPPPTHTHTHPHLIVLEIKTNKQTQHTHIQYALTLIHPRSQPRVSLLGVAVVVAVMVRGWTCAQP